MFVCFAIKSSVINLIILDNLFYYIKIMTFLFSILKTSKDVLSQSYKTFKVLAWIVLTGKTRSSTQVGRLQTLPCNRLKKNIFLNFKKSVACFCQIINQLHLLQKHLLILFLFFKLSKPHRDSQIALYYLFTLYRLDCLSAKKSLHWCKYQLTACFRLGGNILVFIYAKYIW